MTCHRCIDLQDLSLTKWIWAEMMKDSPCWVVSRLHKRYWNKATINYLIWGTGNQINTSVFQHWISVVMGVKYRNKSLTLLTHVTSQAKHSWWISALCSLLIMLWGACDSSFDASYKEKDRPISPSLLFLLSRKVRNPTPIVEMLRCWLDNNKPYNW